MRRYLTSAFILVLIISFGTLCADVHREVVKLSERAAAGDAEAIYTLATLHDRGFDTIPVDSLLSTQLYLQAAEAGYIPAMNYLGYRLLSGEVEAIGRDVEKGMEWLEKAAEAGDPKALSNIGWLLMEGKYVEKDYVKAAYWLSRASRQGLSVAQSMLGDLYRDGKGVPVDTAAADSLYHLAFESGLSDAAYKIEALSQARYDTLSAEELLREGRYFYLRSAPSLGVKLFYRAADMGSADAFALLGDAYTRAIGVPYDHSLSLHYYVKGAMAGNPSAQFVVGELLEIFPDALLDLEFSDGEMPSDSPVYWFEKAAEGGVTDAETATRLLLREEE